MDGIAKRVQIRLGEYVGRIDLMVTEIDDFNLIIKNTFLRTAGMGVFPQLGGVLIMNGAETCFVRCQGKPTKAKDAAVQGEKLVSMQLVRESKPETLVNLAAKVLIQPDQVVTVPEKGLLKAQFSVMSDEWGNSSTPEGVVEHQTTMVPLECAPTEASAWMPPWEFTRLDIQTEEPLSMGKVLPSTKGPILIQEGSNEVKNQYLVSVIADLRNRLGLLEDSAEVDLNSRCWLVWTKPEGMPRESRRDHRGQMRQVVNQFRKHQLGCEFSLRKRSFLGQVYGQVREESEVQSIVEWLKPTVVTRGSCLWEASKEITHELKCVE